MRPLKTLTYVTYTFFFNVCFLAIKCVMIPLVAIETLHKLLGKLQIQLVIGKSAQTLPMLLPHHLNWQ